MGPVLISAGHYPARPGASVSGFVEHSEAVIWRDSVAKLLGPLAVIVPTGYLRDKVQFINAAGAVAAIEIHFNDAWLDRNADGVAQDDEHLGRGSETLYYPGSSNGKRLAEALQAEIHKVFPPNRGVKEGWYRMDPSKGPDFFLARTRCPSVIIEPEFVANAQTIRDRRSAGCAAIARGIISYLG